MTKVGPGPSLAGAWPFGTGEMAERIRAHDWAATPLGPIETWPQNLRSAVDLLLPSGFPMAALWGPELIQIYNDAYCGLMGLRHPAGLGQLTRDCWPEVWNVNEPIFKDVWSGRTLTFENTHYAIVRWGTPEDAWFDVSYSPLRNESGATAGVLVIGVETTERHLSERRRDEAEHALRASEERLRRVLETDAVGLLFFSKEGTLIDANDVFLKTTGWSREDVESGRLSWGQMTPAEWLENSEAQLKTLAVTGRVGPYEKEYLHKDGSRSWMLFAGRDLGDGTIVEFAIDISSQKQAEAALATKLKVTTRLHEVSRRVMQSSDLQTVLDTILEAVIDLQGAAFGNIQLYDSESNTLHIAVQRGFQQPFLDHFAEIDATEGSACGVALARRERVVIEDVDQEPAFAPSLAAAHAAGFRAVQSTPLFTTSGEPLGMLSTHFRNPHRLSASELRFTDVYARLASDAIARSQAEQALRTVQARLQTALRAGHLATWDWDPVSDRVTASDTMADVFGLMPGQTWQSSALCFSLVHPADRERYQATVEAAARDGGSWHSEFRIIRPRDGEVAWLEERAHADRDPQTGKIVVAGLIWDISERKRAEEHLAELQSELLHLARLGAMGQMAAILAHELNQPLTAVANYIHGARRLADDAAGHTSERLRDILRKAADQTLRAGETIRRVREFVSRGKSTRQPEDLIALVKEASALALIGFSTEGIRVTYRLNDQAGRVLADRIQIQQVILNLIRNAMEAMQEVKRRELLIAATPAGADKAEVCVSDTGPGLSPEISVRLFEPFVTSKPKGLGMGLSFCRTIIEAHNGRMWAEPNASGGTSFRFTLPLVRP